jgi:tetratricopeptide (TPR) repeat protein
MVELYYSAGRAYNDMKKYPEAVKYYLLAYKISKRYIDTNGSVLKFYILFTI